MPLPATRLRVATAVYTSTAVLCSARTRGLLLYSWRSSRYTINIMIVQYYTCLYKFIIIIIYCYYYIIIFPSRASNITVVRFKHDIYR